MVTKEVQDLLNLAMKMINYSFKCSKIWSNLVTICLIFERIFPVLNEEFTSLKSSVFGHYSFCFVSKTLNSFTQN
jgi:hypothetical protein